MRKAKPLARKRAALNPRASCYTVFDELAASPTHPLPAEKRTYQLSKMWEGLAAIEADPNPTTDHWRVISDAVNLMESLVEMGVCQDPDGLVQDAVKALAVCAKRRIQQHQQLRFRGAELQTVRGVLEDYAMVLEQVPARSVIRAHRQTERRLKDIISGKHRPHDVEIIEID